MKFTNFKISRECIFPIENVAHVRSRKTFIISLLTFEIPDFIRFQSPENRFLFSEQVRLLTNVYSKTQCSALFNVQFLGFFYL